MACVKSNMGRRSFVIGGALAATAAAGVAARLASAGEEAASAQNDALGAAWDDEADVIVIGGSGGLAGAVATAEAGLDTLLIEKRGSLGGNNSVNSGVFFTCGSAAQKANGYVDPRTGEDDTIEQGVEDSMEATSGAGNRELLAHLYEYGDAIIQDMMDDGYQFSAWTGHDGWPERCHQIVDQDTGEALSTGTGFVNYFADRYEAAGGRTMLSTRARHILLDSENKVCGVEVVDEDGVTRRFAAKAILVATGSYACSTEMVARYHPEARGWSAIGLGHSTGDGITMLLEHDAAMVHVEEAISVVGSEPSTHAISSIENEYGIGFFDEPRSSFLVNDKGERFEDETIGYTANLALGREMTNPYYIIWDQTLQDDENYGVMFGWSHDLAESSVESGLFIKADTVEDLAAAIHVDADTLQASIDSFNATAEGAEDEFGRPQATCRALEAPYYAYRMLKAANGTSLGSMKIDNGGRVVKQDGSVIPGLYGGGNDLVHGNYDGNVYISSGTGCGFSYSMSRYAGEQIVEYVSSLAG